jgi:hypothetical protein
MKKISLIALLATCALGATQIALAQDTTVRVGRIGYGPADLPVVSSASTAQIDPYLNIISPSQFGAHYTRDVANGLFADLNAMGDRIRTQLDPILEADPKITSAEITVFSNPLNLDLWQTSSGVRVEVWGLSLLATVDYYASFGELCGNAHGTFRFNDIRLTSEYNIATGQLQNSNVTFSLGNINVDCTGIFGFVAEYLANNVFMGYARTLIETEVKAAIKDQMHLTDSRTIFSAYNFLEGLRVAGPNTPLGSAANQLVTVAQGVVANPGALNRGVRLSMTAARAPTGNVVSFIVSNVAHSHIDALDYPRGTTTVSLGVGENIGRTDVFYRYPAGTGPWYPLGTTTTSVLVVPGNYPIGTEIGAIGVNMYNTSLRSYLGITKVTEYSGNCTHNCTPQEPE